MKSYAVLLRGINVGGKNKVPMAELRTCLGDLGFSHITTYIASGNVILDSDFPAAEIKTQIEKALPECFKLDVDLLKVLVLTPEQVRTIVHDKPEGFGEEPETYHSDVIFLMDVDVSEALSAFDPREGVDQIWPGQGVIYSQRLSAQRTKSRLNKIMASPLYKSMTIRNWNTTTKLVDMLNERS